MHWRWFQLCGLCNRGAGQEWRNTPQRVDAATCQFGFPLRLRSDMAFEAGFVGQQMWEERGPESYIASRSTGNQVPEP